MPRMTGRPLPLMTKRRTGLGMIDVALMGERREVLIPLIPAWSAHARRIGGGKHR